MKFEQVFNKIINEMKYINGENAVYKINDEAFEPIIYKDVCICASSLNSDLFHVLNRINKRTNGKYTLETILTIIKRYIDKDLNLEKLFRNKKRKTYSCSIVNFSIEVYRKVFVLLEELWVPLCRMFIAAFVSASINNPQEQL